MGGGQRARHALLLTKAKTKNYKPIEDDSLISFAADYYSGHGDSLEAQSLFYLGYYNAEKRINDKALLHLSHAYDAAFAKGDKFYAAMSAREMSIVYRRLLMVDESLKWGRIAKMLFAEAGKTIHAAWMDNMIANDLIFNGNLNSAKVLLDSIASIDLYSDINFRRNTIINRIELALQLDSYKDVLMMYEQLAEEKYAFTAHNRLNQAKAAIELGMLEDAGNYISMARQLSMSEADSLYEGNLLSLLYAARGDFRKAYETSAKFGNEIMSSDARRLTKPQTQLLTDNYKLNADIHRLQAEKKSTYIVGLTVVCLLLGVLIYIIWKYYKSRLANRMHEIEQLVSSSHILMEDLTLSNKRYNELTEENITLRDSIAGKESEIDRLKAASNLLNDGLAESESRYRKVSEENTALRNSIAGQDAGFEKEVRSIFGRHIDLFNNICAILHKHKQAEGKNEINYTILYKKIYNEIGSVLNEINHINVIEELGGIIDKYDNNWATRFRNSYSGLKDEQYLLAIYLYLGFRPTTIAMLSNYDRVDAVYTAKSRLKKILMSESKTDDVSWIKTLFE